MKIIKLNNILLYDQTYLQGECPWLQSDERHKYRWPTATAWLPIRGFVVATWFHCRTLGLYQPTSAVLCVLSSFLGWAEDAVPVKAAQMEKPPWIHPRSGRQHGKPQHITNPQWPGARLLSAQHCRTRCTAHFHFPSGNILTMNLFKKKKNSSFESAMILLSPLGV